MLDAESDLLIQALRDIADKTTLISPQLILTISKPGQTFLQVLADKSALSKDVFRQSSLFCEGVFNEKSGRNLAHQDENTLALWMVAALINELFDLEKMKSPDLFAAQKEKILDLLEKEPFFVSVVEVPSTPVMEIIEVIETPVETPVEVLSVKPEEKAPIVEVLVPKIAPVEKIEPIVPSHVFTKEYMTAKLEKIRSEIAEKAKLFDINKIKSEFVEKTKLMRFDKINKVKEDLSQKTKAGFSAIKNLFRKK